MCDFIVWVIKIYKNGSNPTCQTSYSTCELDLPLHHPAPWWVVPSLVPYFSFCTLVSYTLSTSPTAIPLQVGTDFIAVQDLGILLNSDMSISFHVRKTVSTCFAVQRLPRSIRRSESRPMVQSLVTSLVFSRLDYGNATLERYSSTFSSAVSVIDECICSTNLLVVEVWSHHSAPPSTSLAEGKGTYWFQTHSHYVQMCQRDCNCHTSLMNLVIQLIPRLDADFARHHHLCWSSINLALRPWMISHFAASCIWNNLPQHVIALPSLPFESLKIVLRLIFFLHLFLDLYILFL